jgi:two-component system, chemotaxis family, sensor kinase CheA
VVIVDMDELLQDFLAETGENLETVDLELVRFEQEPGNEGILRNIFRLVHTIKGTCGFLGLARLEALAHAAETVMGQFRDGAPATPDAVTLILSTIDRVKEILADLGRAGQEPDGDDHDLIDALEHLARQVEQSSSNLSMVAIDPEPSAIDRELRPGEVSLDELERAFRETEGPESDQKIAQKPVKDLQPEAARIYTPRHAAAAEAMPTEAQGDAKSAAAQTLRVNVGTLEHLMTMVSELVLTRNQLLEIARRENDSSYKGPLQRLSHITAELQDGVMKTRMQPIGNAWSKLPRIIRDLSAELDKKIDLVLDGADTELDRQVLELIKDPLTHMVRNSADHGIETSAERRSLGKPEHGVIKVSAFHEGGQITIEVKDDGKGLDLARIRRKAADAGLASGGEIERMTDDQIARFIFHPGLSTASKVTSVSGRGVGMDVVKSNVDAIGGLIDITTEPGKGTTISVKIPLTLAIVSALIVLSGKQRFAIPQSVVRELVRVKADSEHQIESINGAPVLRLRDRLLPVIAMSSLMGLSKTVASEGFIVVTQVGSRQFGIMVDAVFHTEEIVVKPMSAKLRHVQMFSGNTILGDGAVVLIIDPNGISRMVGTVDGEADREQAMENLRAGTVADLVTMLIFKSGSAGFKAIPISVVTRLEEVDASKIEFSGGRAMLQYRGKLMPVVPASPDIEIRTEGMQPLIIFSDGERAMGMAVDSIVDIVDEKLNIELSQSAGDSDIIGSAVIRGRATDILDVAHFLPKAHPDWLQGQRRDSAGTAPPHLLLVDPSVFFSEMLSPVLKAAGFRVTLAGTMAEAEATLRRHHDIMATVVDVEAENGAGFAFVEHVRTSETGSMLPVIALAAFASLEIASRARELGIRQTVAKFDRKGLIAALADLTSPLKKVA